jgi:hypothetical protein
MTLACFVASSAPPPAPVAWGRSEVIVVVAAMALVACNVGVRCQSAPRTCSSMLGCRPLRCPFRCSTGGELLCHVAVHLCGARRRAGAEHGRDCGVPLLGCLHSRPPAGHPRVCALCARGHPACLPAARHRRPGGCVAGARQRRGVVCRRSDRWTGHQHRHAACLPHGSSCLAVACLRAPPPPHARNQASPTPCRCCHATWRPLAKCRRSSSWPQPLAR